MSTMQLQFKNMDRDMETIGEFKTFFIKTPTGKKLRVSWSDFTQKMVISSEGNRIDCHENLGVVSLSISK